MKGVIKRCIYKACGHWQETFEYSLNMKNKPQRKATLDLDIYNISKHVDIAAAPRS